MENSSKHFEEVPEELYFQIDTENPWVSLHLWADYPLGTVFSISFENDKEPGFHRDANWITLTRNFYPKYPFSVEVVKDLLAISLRKLVREVGEVVGINPHEDIENISDNPGLVSAMIYEFARRKVPESLQNQKMLSAVEGLEEEELRSGIVCDSLDQVEAMLHYYGQGRVSESNLTRLNDIYHIAGLLNGKAEGRKTHEEIQKEIDMVTKIMKEEGKTSCAQGLLLVKNFMMPRIKEACNKGEGQSFSFQYEVQSTNFFKTFVRVHPRGDKFILNIRAAYVGNRPEIELAKAMNAERLLYKKVFRYKLSAIGDSDWVGVDLGRVLEDILPDEDIERLAKIASGEHDHSCIVATIKDMPIIMKVEFSKQYDDNDFRDLAYPIRVNNRLFFNKWVSSWGYKHAYITFALKPKNEDLSLQSGFERRSNQ